MIFNPELYILSDGKKENIIQVLSEMHNNIIYIIYSIQ